MYYQTIKKMDTKSKLVKRVIRALISEKNQKQLSMRLKDKSRARMIKKYCNKKETSLKSLFQTCLEHISPVTTPPALISQIQHSGGSQLNRLFDGHPAIYAYPDELMKGGAAKIPWTEIDPKDDPQRWIDIFFDYFNPPNIPQRFNPDPNHKGALPFVFFPLLQKQIFIKYLNTIKLIKPRDVFDAYMTACFGAWLNYQNHSQHKKFVTVLAPGLVELKENMESFFEIYSDGRIISLVGDPHNWYNSALQAEPEKYADVNWSMMRWKDSLHSALWAKEHFAEHTCLIKVEDLLNKPEPVMRYLSDFLGINYDVIILKPTFNSFPIAGQNSFTKAEGGGNTGNSYANLTLDKNKLKIIEDLTCDDYQAMLHEVVNF